MILLIVSQCLRGTTKWFCGNGAEKNLESKEQRMFAFAFYTSKPVSCFDLPIQEKTTRLCLLAT